MQRAWDREQLPQNVEWSSDALLSMYPLLPRSLYAEKLPQDADGSYHAPLRVYPALQRSLAAERPLLLPRSG